MAVTLVPSTNNPLAQSLDDFQAQEQATKARVLRDNWINSADTNPVALASQRALAKATQIPVDALFADPAAAKRHEALQSLDADRLLTEHPAVANFLLDGDMAGLYRDKTPELSVLDKALAQVTGPWSMGADEAAAAPGIGGKAAAYARAAAASLGGAMTAIPGVEYGFRIPGAAITGLNAALYNLSGALVEPFAAGLVAPMFGQDNAASRFARSALATGAAFDKKAEATSGLTAGMNVLQRGVIGGLRSATEMVLMMPLALTSRAFAESVAYTRTLLATPEVAAAAKVYAGTAGFVAPMSAVTGGRTYSADRAKGVDIPTAMGHALSNAVIEGGTEMAPASVLLRESAGLTKNLFMATMKSQPKDIIGELGAMLGQGFNEWTVIDRNKGKTFAQFVAELPENAVETIVATLVAGVTQAGALHYTGRIEKDQTEDTVKRIADMFAAAGKVLDRGPDNLRAFFQSVAPDATAFIDATKLIGLLNQSKLDIATVLPTAAAQIERGEIAGPGGLEIPIGELITGLAGTGVEAEIVNHLKLDPGLPSLAEQQAHGEKAAEFLQQENDRIVEKYAKDEAFVEDQRAVHDDMLDQLTQAGAYRSSVNRAYAQHTANMYTVLAERLGVTPKQVRDGYTDAKGKAHRGYKLSIYGKDEAPTTGDALDQGFNHGQAMLNVGLSVGLPAPGAQTIDAALVEAELAKMGVQVLSSKEVPSQYPGDGGAMVDELTYVPHLSRPLTADEVMQLTVATKQDAIPQYYDGVGTLHGTPENLAKYGGAFNGKYFKDQKGVALADAEAALSQAQSTRRPTKKRAPEDHLGEVPLTVDYTKIEDDKNAQNMALVAKYPGIRFKARKAEGRVEEFIQHVTDNLLWLHDQIPADVRQRSKLWYDGARAITDRWTKKYGKSDAQIAAILAIFSPQKDWFMNVSLAERTLDIVQNQQDTAWSPEMTEAADQILADEKFSMLRGAIEGKKLSELKDRLEQAAWLRTFDEAHNNRGHRLATPEGGFIEFATSVKGVEKKTGWPGFGTIIKALYVIDDGSAKMIDNALGGEHKVRSFYNNIFHPNSDAGFVTIDTHAVAAGLLRPLSGNSAEVSHNFGGDGTAISAATGMSGTYPYYQEAYRRAAEARGLLPREMQSITWEAVRELYTMGFKHDTAKMAVVDKLWSEYEKGKRDLESVRAGILNLAGGVEQPSWVGRDSGISPEGWASTYTRELLGDSVPGRDTGGVDAGAGERAPAGNTARLNQTKTGAVSGPVVGVHFSNQPRTALSSGMFGTGAKAEEATRVAAAKDPRIKQRITFYVNTGAGITPEQGVGAVAHTATLDNLYDADADALKIFRNGKGDMNAVESAILDAGFDGYLTREFGKQGAAVLLGPRAQQVAATADTNVPAAPSAQIPAAKAMASALIRNRALPGGQMMASEWQALLEKNEPETAAQIPWGKIDPNKMFYKDDLAGMLWQAAYHGTHARGIKQFSTEFMGTGEGAQAFGWGLYFAGDKAVAEYYRSSLVDPAPIKEMRIGTLYLYRNEAPVDYSPRTSEDADHARAIATEYIMLRENDIRRAWYDSGIEGVKAIAAEELDGLIARFTEEHAPYVSELKALRRRTDNPTTFKFEMGAEEGQVYKVDIPEHDEYLDWDIPLAEQSKDVRKKLEAALKKASKAKEPRYEVNPDAEQVRAAIRAKGPASQMTPEDVQAYNDAGTREGAPSSWAEELLNAVHWDRFAGAKLYQTLEAELGSDEAASKWLNAAGIPGIRYPDSAFRAGNDGAYNYVVFDDNAITVMDEFYQGGQWYFSQLQRAIEGAPAKVFGNGKAVAQWLTANAGKLGVKKAEIEATGITDWLATQDKVTKEQVVAFIEQGGVKIEEVVLGEADDSAVAAWWTDEGGANEETPFDELSLAEQEAAREQYRTDVQSYGDSGGTKFSGYVLPGGQNYRELLLTLPSARDISYQMQALQSEMDIIRRGRLPEDMSAEENARFDAVLADYDALKTKKAAAFRSAHWDQPNVIAHTRIDDVTGADGQRYLRVIEIQSDWGQKGKKEGFDKDTRKTKPLEPGEYEAFIKRMRQAAGEVFRQRGGEQVDDAMVESLTKTLPIQDLASWAGMADEYLSITERQNEDWNRRDGRNAVVPSAPFVTDTKAWTALVVKRTLALAVQEGYAGVVFATGQQNADLYDLSKSVDAIHVQINDDGTRSVAVDAQGNPKFINMDVGDDGKVSFADSQPELIGKDLADVIGKEAADKAMAAEADRTLSGLDLKVGGEGMRAYYDDIVPQVVRDVLKKLGAGDTALTKIELNAGKMERLGPSKFKVTLADGTHYTFASEQNAQAYLDKFGVQDAEEQPGFAITDTLRNNVAEGLPLFASQQEGPKLGSFNPATLEMRLLADANLSTFLHETAHFFLTVYTDVASQPDAPQAIVDDVNALLKWFGVPDVATWNAMTLDQQRPYHEQFAESFEQYLFSGKSPSLEMQSLFKRFASWLKKVYGSLQEFVATHTGAKLNPEVAAVMDRMVATEKEIADANASQGFSAMFKDAVEAGMTDTQFAAYMALDDAQREDAEAMLRTRSLRDMKWLQSQRNKIIAALQADSREKRAEMLTAVKKELAATPLRRAMRWLKKGEVTTDAGDEVKAQVGHRLQIAAVEALFPEGALTPRPDLSKLGYGQYGMLAAEGQSPDVVAEMFGFPSGEALVRELVAAPKFSEEAEALTDQRMLEEYGDLSSPEAMARAADEAIHNDFRTRTVATELAALATNVGTPATLAKAAKEYARRVIEQRTSKTLKPWAFAAAATRAGKDALRALRTGDRDAAAVAKRTELVNQVSTKEAYAAEAEIKKIVDRFKKMSAYADDSSAVKTRDAELVAAVRAILADFGIGERKGKTAREYLAVVEQHNPDLAAVLSDVIDSVTASAKDWRQLKVSELRDLAEEIDGIWFLAKRAKQIEIDGKLVPLVEAQNAIYTRLDEIGIPDRVPGEGSAVTAAEKRGIMFDRFVGALRRVEAWVGAKDGSISGPFRTFMWNPIRDAADAYRADKVKYLKAYRDLLQGVAPTLTRRLIEAPEIGYVFGKDESGMGKAELLHAILHTGNASNKRKLLLGRGWATEKATGAAELNTSKWDAFIKRMHDTGVLTKADYEFAQGVWDMLESMKPLAQQAHRDVFGKYFAEITADKFVTPFGEYAGGYVPAVADPMIVRDADLNRLREGEEANMSFAFPTTAKGFTKGRVEYNRPLRLNLGSITQHIDKVLLFSHMTRPVNDVRRVLTGKGVAQALGRVDPQAVNTLLIPWLNRAAKQVVETPTPGREGLGRFWSVVRTRAGMAAMFANVANSVQQITGLFLAAVRVRPALLLDAMAKFAMSPAAMADHVTSKSTYMATRMENEVAAMSSQINEILLNPSVYQSAQEWTMKHGYFLQSAVDSVISPVVWLAGYNQAIEAGMEEADAVRAGDSAVRETQGSQAPEDVASFETGSAFYRMFVQFAGYFNMNANLLGTEYVKITRDMGLRKGTGRGLYVMLFGFLAPAVVGELVMQIFKGGPDDDDKDGEYLDDWLKTLFGYAPLRYATAMVPGFGQAINAGVNTLNNKPYDDRISTAPAISMIESAGKAPLAVYKAIFEDGKPSRAIKDVATLVSMAVGVPATALARPVSYLADVAAARVQPTGPVDAVRGTITGTASPASKQ